MELNPGQAVDIAKGHFYPLIALPTATAQSTRATHAYIGATPNPVGVDQETLLHTGIMQQLNLVQQGWEGLTVTVEKPDGTTQTPLQKTPSRKQPPKQAFSPKQSIEFISINSHASHCARRDFCIAIVVGVENRNCIETERCTRQSARNASKNAKFRSNLTKAGQFTAEHVSQNEDHKDIRLSL